jgi:hypothetical protein
MGNFTPPNTLNTYNLVPLYVDKETGKTVATGERTAASPGTTEGNAFFQTVESTTWTITHNKNTTTFVYQIFTNTMEQVWPDFVTINDPNEMTIHFLTAMSGVVYIIFFK